MGARKIYTCGFCGGLFSSDREITGAKLCEKCLELRRLIRRWQRQGRWMIGGKEGQQANGQGFCSDSYPGGEKGGG